jgi:ABC-type transport system involved in cytochrome c biogenesis permease component
MRAVLLKEARSEIRSRHGLFTASLFGLLTVVALVFAVYSSPPNSSTAAGLLCVGLVFSAIVTMPRSMIVEDEQGTFALLQLLADPAAAFFGKLLFNAIQGLAGSIVLSAVFLAMLGTPVDRPAIFAVALVLFPLALAGGTTFCSALVIGATNRWVLAGVVAMPMLVPVVFLGVSAVRCGLGAGFVGAGVESLVALGGYALVTFSAGPRLVALVWKN